MATDPVVENTQETSNTKSTQKVVAERVPGSTMLPIARVKRVIKEDKDISLINAEATFCIAYATELFLEYLVTEAFSKAKKEKRKTIYYRDLSGSVKEVDHFEFLEDVIPPTMTLKSAIEKRKAAMHDDTPLVSSPPAKKQKSTTTAEEPLTTNQNEEGKEEEEEEEEEDVTAANAEEDMNEEEEEEAEEEDTVMEDTAK